MYKILFYICLICILQIHAQLKNSYGIPIEEFAQYAQPKISESFYGVPELIRKAGNSVNNENPKPPIENYELFPPFTTENLISTTAPVKPESVYGAPYTSAVTPPSLPVDVYGVPSKPNSGNLIQFYRRPLIPLVNGFPFSKIILVPTSTKNLGGYFSLIQPQRFYGTPN